MVDWKKDESVQGRDRRATSTVVTSADIASLVETIQTVVGTLHQHSTDIAVIKTYVETQGDPAKAVAVLETKMQATESRLGNIESDVREVKHGVSKIFDTLNVHTKQEDADRQRLLKRLNGLLLGVISTLLTSFGWLAWEYIIRPRLA
jgi:uncharacterized protein YfcZ (UPF0381/DUF406 family)